MGKYRSCDGVSADKHTSLSFCVTSCVQPSVIFGRPHNKCFSCKNGLNRHSKNLHGTRHDTCNESNCFQHRQRGLEYGDGSYEETLHGESKAVPVDEFDNQSFKVVGYMMLALLSIPFPASLEKMMICNQELIMMMIYLFSATEAMAMKPKHYTFIVN